MTEIEFLLNRFILAEENQFKSETALRVYATWSKYFVNTDIKMHINIVVYINVNFVFPKKN